MSLISNIVSYWKLDSNSNDTLLVNNGSNTSITYGTPAKIGSAVQFNGTTSRINLGNGCTVTAGLTISMWVQSNSTALNQMLFSKSNGSAPSSDSYYLYYFNSGGGNYKLGTFVGNGTTNYFTESAVLSLATMTHVVFTDDLTTTKIYINGVLNTSVAHATITSINATASQAWIGASGSSPSLFFSGSIDEVGLWNRAITTSEVSQLYNTGLGSTYPFVTLKTDAVSNISLSTATYNGEIINDGGATITERGFAYATTPSPTIANTKKTVSGTIGVYSAAITGLAVNTTYYVRAYATNANGTEYGNEVSFTTLNIGQYKLQKEINAIEGDTFVGQINVTGTLGTITVQLGTTGSTTIINAGAGASAFSGTYSGLSGLIITRSADFNGTIDNVYYAKVPLGTTIDWTLNTVAIITSIPSEVFFKRVEDQIFNNFRFYRYLDLLFKDLDGFVTVTVRQEREDNTTEKSKVFVVGNTGSGTVSPFQKKRISFLCKDQAIIIGLSNDNLNETFSIAQYLLIGDKKPRRTISPSKIISIN